MTLPFHVLVVDDAADKRLLLRTALERAGYTVDTAADGTEGLRKMQQGKTDLVITDVQMPNMDGYELARRLRVEPTTRHIPVLIQTAVHRDDRDVRQGYDAGALGYFTDPSDVMLLLSRARTLLEFKCHLDSYRDPGQRDPLSGFVSAPCLQLELERELARSTRSKRAFSVIALKIDDGLERLDVGINESVIRAVANVLQSGCRNIDLIGHTAKRDFALVLPETDLGGACELAERLRVAIGALQLAGSTRITASIGVAAFTGRGESSQDLLSAANNAAYEAKRLGGNRVECHLAG